MKNCWNCDWFVCFPGNRDPLVEVCCKHKLMIETCETSVCDYWTPIIKWADEDDDLHDNDAMDGSEQTDDQSVPDKE